MLHYIWRNETWFNSSYKKSRNFFDVWTSFHLWSRLVRPLPSYSSHLAVQIGFRSTFHGTTPRVVCATLKLLDPHAQRRQPQCQRRCLEQWSIPIKTILILPFPHLQSTSGSLNMLNMYNYVYLLIFLWKIKNILILKKCRRH